MTFCLELMLNDDGIQEYTASQTVCTPTTTSWPLTDVLVNVRVIKSPLACYSEADCLSLGLREHVCEIQLAAH